MAAESTDPRAAAREGWERLLAEQRRRGVSNPERILQQVDYALVVLPTLSGCCADDDGDTWLRRQRARLDEKRRA